MKGEVQIVDAVQGVEVLRASMRFVLVVHVGGSEVAIKHVLVITAQHMDMSAHVYKVARIGQVLVAVTVA